MVSPFKNRKGATLVELIMVMVVVAIVGAAIAGAVVFLVQLFMYSPRQLDTQKIGGELTSIMIEGTSSIRGIRYSKSVIDASSTQFSYTYGYPTVDEELSARFRWNSGDSHIYRSTSTDGGSNWTTEAVIPYYITASTTVDGKDTAGVIFTYKKAADADWVGGVDPLADIRRVIIGINVKTGTGSFDDFQGSSDITSSAEIKSF